MFTRNLFTFYAAYIAISPVFICESSEVDEKPFLAPFLNKKYKLKSSDENFPKILKTLGVDPLTSKALLADTVMELEWKGDHYILSLKSIYKSVNIPFKIGKEFTEVTPDGRTVKTLFTQDKNKLTQTQRGAKTTIIVREFTPEKVNVQVKVDDIVSNRVYLLDV